MQKEERYFDAVNVVETLLIADIKNEQLEGDL